MPFPPLHAFRRNWLAQAEFSEDIPTRGRCGLSFFFLDAVERAEFYRRVPFRPDALGEEDALREKYDFIPRTWIKLHYNGAELNGYSQYFVVTPENHYPITTLRQLMRRFHCAADDVRRLEPALEPALSQSSAMWAIILKWRLDGPPVMRMSCTVSRGLLQPLLPRLSEHGFLDAATVTAYLQAEKDVEAADKLFLTFEPGAPKVLALDYEYPSAACLERLGGPPGARYLKLRLDSNGVVWTAYRPLPDALAPEELDALCDVRRAPADVRDYFDTHSDTILRDVGTTYQASQLPTGARDTNLALAAMASIEAGMRILDLGCGAGGPAVDIASHYEGVRIDAVTISAKQAEDARRHVEGAGLSDRIQVICSDFEALKCAANSYDRVLFLESLNYAAHLKWLSSVRLMLVPGGRVFIKDVFINAPPLQPAQRLELAEFREVYACRGFTSREIVNALQEAGFHGVQDHPLDDRFNMNRYYQAMADSEFGRHHFRRFLHLPVTFRCISATN